MRLGLALALAVLSAGCTAPDSPEGAAEGAAPLGREDIEAPHEAAAPGWPSLDAATIRPGVQIQWLFWNDETDPVEVLSACTADFLFRSRDNASLFLGVAAHCLLDSQVVGAPVAIDKGAASGTVWYSAWQTMEAEGVRDEEARNRNDFALIRIDDEHRGKVHPAVMRYGGPVGLADAADIHPGDGVLAYGHSDLRQRTEPTNWHEGCIASVDEQYVVARFWHPALPGDSGSPVLTEDGRALGVLVDLVWAPQRDARHQNGILLLAPLLEYAKEHAGVDVELVTWPLLEPPLLPSPPLCQADVTGAKPLS